MQKLGEQLIELTDEQLNGIGLDDQLRDAIIRARSIKAHGALRRQKQLIGKLMRKADPEPIRRTLDALQRDNRVARRIFHDAELWRNRLLDEGDDALADYLQFLGHEDTSVTESLQAHHRAGSDKSRKTAARQVFRHVHDDIERKVQKEADSI